jgi:hypothetical protein
MPSFGTYKDKPYYGGAHPARRHRWYTSKWAVGTLVVFAFFFLMHRIVPRIQYQLEEEVARSSTGSPAEEDGWEARQGRVRDAFLYSWKGYVQNAWGKDEYRPISGTGVNMIPQG